MNRWTTRAGGLVAALALLGLGAQSALATTRYAQPFASGAQPCAQSDPCSLPTALTGTGPNGIADGDTVVLTPGTYHPGSSLTVNNAVTIEGQPGAATPVIEGAGTYGLETLSPVDLHDVRIDQASGSDGLLMFGGSAERVAVSSEAAGHGACGFLGTTVSDSACWDLASGGYGILPEVSSAVTWTTTLRNVTAVGDVVGIEVEALAGGSLTVHATNAIAYGVTGQDAVAYSDSSPGSSAALTLSHSAFRDSVATGIGASVTAPGANGGVTAAPLFANLPAGDFHEAAGSPTIGVGDLSALVPGETDLDRVPRAGPLACGGATVIDIGAYQTHAPTGCSGPPAPPAPPAGTSSVVTPTLHGLSLTHTHFAVAGAKHHRKGIAYGTTLRFTLSAPAKTTLTVWAKRHGHRHGKSCVTKHSSGKACTRLVRIGSLTIDGHAGANTVRFTGRIGRHTLKPGSYVAKLVATIGSRASRTLTHDFAIVRG
jgi:hypothetical protein